VFSLSPIKLMVIVGVVLLLMGPDKLPEVAHKLGSTWRAIKNLQEKVEAEVREAIPDLPSTGDIARIARSPVNLLNQLADRVDAKEAAARSSASTNETVSEETPPPLVSPPIPPPRMASTDDASLPPDPSLN
jgi:TatA/E family protein of Tat protein translocase